MNKNHFLPLATALFVLSFTALESAPDTVDSAFAASAGQVFDSTDFGGVSSSLVQPDGKVIFGSNEMAASIPGLGLRQVPLIRFNTDGTVDTIYGADSHPDGEGTGIVFVGQGWPEVHAVALQADGKLIAAGVMTGYTEPGTLQNFGGMSIVRFNADGTADGSFATKGTVAAAGLNYINDVEVQADGKIVVAGGFDGFRNANNDFFSRKGIARLNADGTVDTSFAINPADFGAGNSQFGFFRDVELSPDGKLYVIGEFYTGFNTDQVVFARLNADGSRDSTFQPIIPADLDNPQAVDIDASGRVVLIGSGNNLSVGYMQRFFASGALDPTFNLDSSLIQASNEQLEETSTGQYYIFTNQQGFNDRLVRINSDGSLDTSFNAQSDWADAPFGPSAGSLRCLALAPDGSVYSGAAFNTVNGVSTRKVVKFEGDFNPTSPGTVAFAGVSYEVGEDVGTVTISVTRAGGVNGAASVSFATSNGSATAGSDYTASSGTLNWAAGEGGVKTFTIGILSDAAIEAGETVNLSLSGATGATLGLSAATLTINDSDSAPVIVSNPPAQTFVVPDARLSLSVSAVSAASPTTYQWYKDGILIPGATSPLYSVAAAQTSQSGLYYVVVTNPNGFATSADAEVSVKTPATLAFSGPATVDVVESDGSFDLTLSRTDSAINEVSVRVTALSDTATEGADFSAFSQIVTWADGDTADKVVTFNLTDDGLSEPGERFTVELSDWSLDARALPSSLTVVEVLVADDDSLPLIDSQSDPVITSEGSSVALSVSVSSQTAVTYQWYLDGQLLNGETGDSINLTNLEFSDAGVYTVEITNSAGTLTSAPIAVQVTPADLLLAPLTVPVFTSGSPIAAAPAAGGGIYVGGSFNTVDGQFIRTLARLNVDGTLDASFDAGLSTSETISHLRVTASGDLIVAGEDFSTNANALDNRLTKISSAGVVDASFAANVGAAFDGEITDVEIAADGSIYVVGEFTGRMKKLSATGVVDTNFAPLHGIRFLWD